MIEEKLFVIGFVLLFLGILFIIISSFLLTKSEAKKIEVAAGGFIGPFPFGFFTSRKMFWIWLFLFIVLLLVWFLLRKKF